jgi:1-deoxy-D-xylulose-5-phosphate synthase
VNARFVKPLDREMLFDVMGRFSKVITVEDNTIVGGFGSAVSEFAVQHGFKNDILIHGVPDRFIDHGKPEELHKDLRLDSEGIFSIAKEFVSKKILHA